jgi:hypothetical protein
MIDGTMLEWLAAHSENFQVRCNPHQESHTTIARHLLHRERVGEAPRFSDSAARSACLNGKTLWEISIRHADGRDTHLAGPSLDNCLKQVRTLFGPTLHHPIAA